MTTTIKLTDVQINILSAMEHGGLLVLDRQNTLRIDDLQLQPRTREILVKAHFIERLDKTRATATKGNGFVITEQGRSALLQARQTQKEQP